VKRYSTGQVKGLWVSARTGQGVDRLVDALAEHFKQGQIEVQVCLPPAAGKLRSEIYRKLQVVSEDVLDSGDVVLRLELSQNDVKWLNANRDFRSEYWTIVPDHEEHSQNNKMSVG